MGMIQIDMPMPTNCLDCPACNEYLMCAIPCNGRGWGENDVRDYSQSRPEWCPMKEQELVRCKDCKHGYLCENDVRCENKNNPAMIGQHNSFDWFCADGERK